MNEDIRRALELGTQVDQARAARKQARATEDLAHATREQTREIAKTEQLKREALAAELDLENKVRAAKGKIASLVYQVNKFDSGGSAAEQAINFSALTTNADEVILYAKEQLISAGEIDTVEQLSTLERKISDIRRETFADGSRGAYCLRLIETSQNLAKIKSENQDSRNLEREIKCQIKDIEKKNNKFLSDYISLFGGEKGDIKNSILDGSLTIKITGGRIVFLRYIFLYFAALLTSPLFGLWREMGWHWWYVIFIGLCVVTWRKAFFFGREAIAKRAKEKVLKKNLDQIKKDEKHIEKSESDLKKLQTQIANLDKSESRIKSYLDEQSEHLLTVGVSPTDIKQLINAGGR
jgi:hypothetical protein